MLRISRGRETLTIKGDHLETNFKGFYQKSLHWRPRSPMETSVHNPAIDFKIVVFDDDDDDDFTYVLFVIRMIMH